MGEDLKLLSVWYSPFGCAVKCALQLKGLKYEYLEDDLDNKSELLLKYNPVHKKVPVLVHGGKPIVESLVIMEYIDKTWPGKFSILPKDPKEREEAWFWGKYLQENESKLWWLLRATEETKEKQVGEIKEILKNMEEKGLGGKKFFGDEDIGFVDLSVGTYMRWYRAVEEIKGIKVFETFTKLQADTMNWMLSRRIYRVWMNWFLTTRLVGCQTITGSLYQ